MRTSQRYVNVVNPSYSGVVDNVRAEFDALLKRAKCDDFVYISRHFVERIVERGLQTKVDIIFIMLAQVIKQYRSTTYESRTYCVKHKTYSLSACIETGVVTGKRKLVAKTFFDSFSDLYYDEFITL